jgi:hypothetical protein
MAFPIPRLDRSRITWRHDDFTKSLTLSRSFPIKGLSVLSLLWMVSQPLLLRGQFPTFELQSLSQPVAQIGSTIELSLTGSRADELHSLQFSAPQITATQLFDPPLPFSDQPRESGKFKTAISSEASPGACEVRGCGRYGVSNPRRMWLTRTPVVAVTADHSYVSAAHELSGHKIVVARCQPQKRNYYRLQLTAGQSLHLAVFAQQLDSRARPVVTLNADQRELTRERAVGFYPATIDYQATQDIELILVVHDAIYQGGAEYGYALEYVIDSSAGPTTDLELVDLLSPKLRGQAPRNDNLERLAVSESRIASVTESPTATELPLQVLGTFPADRTSHTYDFAGQKGQLLSISVTSHSAGQLTDPRLVIYRVLAQSNPEPSAAQTPPAPELKQIVEQDDPPGLGDAATRIAFRDPSLTWTVPETGLYRIEIQDNESSPRPAQRMQYVLCVATADPQFDLLVYPPYPTNTPAQSRPYELNLMRGGTAALRVIALRHDGFNQPIEISLSGLPDSVVAHPITLHPSQSQAEITLICNDKADAWCGPIQVWGQAPGDDASKRQALPATITWPASPIYNAVQNRLCSQLSLSVNALDVSPLTVTLGSPAVIEVKQGEKVSIPIQVQRRDGGAVASVLRPKNLIAKVTAPEVTIAADKQEGACELSVAADAPTGEFDLWLQAESKIKWRENPQALQRAEERLSKLNALLADSPSATSKQSLEEAIKQVTADVEALKKSTAEKELTVWLPTPTQRIRVLAK